MSDEHGYRTLSISNIEKRIRGIEQDPSISQLVYTNLDTLARCVDSIFRHNGEPSWVADVHDANGQPVFNPNEYTQIHEAFSVFFPMLYSFFGKQQPQQYQHTQQRGGQNEIVEQPNQTERVKQLEARIKELEQQATQKGNDSKSPSMGVDALYRKVVETLGKFNSSVVNFASTYGILRLEKQFDNAIVDPKPLTPLAAIPIPGMQVIAQIPVPIRIIVMFLYTCADIARIMIGISPTDRPFIRKVLSIVMAVVDILRGDWKKAILSFSTYFSNEYTIMSVIGKVILDVAGLISPLIQYHMTYGLLDISKSLLAGFLLSMYQIFAIEQKRRNVIQGIEKIKQVANNNKKVLDTYIQNPEQRELYASFLNPSFQDIQTIQSVFINDALQCDPVVIAAVRDIVGEPGNEEIIMKIALELIGVPVDAEELARRCPPIPTTYSKAISQDAVDIAGVKARPVVQPQLTPTEQPGVAPQGATDDQQVLVKTGATPQGAPGGDQDPAGQQGATPQGTQEDQHVNEIITSNLQKGPAKPPQEENPA
jgi:hypothetical protein